MSELTAERVRSLFFYDPVSGLLTRRVRTANCNKAGDIVGADNGKGYLQVEVDGSTYKVHRIIFLHVIGRFPEDQVDHINHKRADNRWVNLREATQLQNSQNRTLSKVNKTGVSGVTFRKDCGKYRARIKVDLKEISLGSFKELSEAIKARLDAEKIHDFHENHGLRT